MEGMSIDLRAKKGFDRTIQQLLDAPYGAEN